MLRERVIIIMFMVGLVKLLVFIFIFVILLKDLSFIFILYLFVLRCVFEVVIACGGGFKFEVVKYYVVAFMFVFEYVYVMDIVF